MKARFVDDTFQDIINAAPQEAHFIVDMLASKPIGRTIALFIAGENLFDNQYIADGFGESPGAPRRMSAGVRLAF